MNNVKVALNTSGIMKHLKANIIWKPLIRIAKH